MQNTRSYIWKSLYFEHFENVQMVRVAFKLHIISSRIIGESYIAQSIEPQSQL